MGVKMKVSVKEFLNSSGRRCVFCVFAEANPEIYKEIVEARKIASNKFGSRRILQWLRLNEIEVPQGMTLSAIDHHFTRGDQPNV